MKQTVLIRTRERIVQLTKVFEDEVDVIFADPDLAWVAQTLTRQLRIELGIALLLLNIYSTTTIIAKPCPRLSTARGPCLCNIL